MSLSFEGFVQRRPFLYHLTSQSNLASIKSSGELFSATDLLESAGREQLIGKKRPKSVQIALKGLSISLRDQEPLHAGNIELQHGWTFSDVVEMLNKHVYFWPGTASGPHRLWRSSLRSIRGSGRETRHASA